jgi:hypothetical protein
MITDEIEHVGSNTHFYDHKPSDLPAAGIPYGLKEKLIFL